ncbi:MAG: 66, gp66 [Frankiales bacterium]|nr:66, gp66 [Frankiales bacterium]
MRARSLKAARLYRQRRALVAQLLEERPICERCHAARSVDLHERKNRSQGGDLLNPAGISCLCRACHRFVTENPLASHAEGFTVWSWEDSA